MASIKAGFLLNKIGLKTLGPESKCATYITLGCQSSRLYEKRKKSGKEDKQRKTSTSRPTSTIKLCPFKCYLKMFKTNHSQFPGRWILQSTKQNIGQHYGHWQMKPSQLRVCINKMTKEEKKIACQCSQINFTAASSTALINLRNELGIKYSDDQIRHLNRMEEKKLNALSADASSADQIIHAFQQRTDVAYLSVTYSPTQGLMLSMTNQQKEQLNKDIYLNRLSYDEESLKTRQDLEHLYNSSIPSTANGGSGRLLLIFFYASEEELRLIRMFPEFVCCDTTFGTNRDKKELFTVAGLDGNNHAFNAGRAFRPSGQSWVFNLLFKHCLKLFWGNEVAQKLRLVLTDGCIQEYLAFIHNSGPNSSFPNAIHGLCNFHLLNIGFNKHIARLLLESKCCSEACLHC